MNRKKKITIKDVANLSGFSISTVSHVINGTRYVEENTREKVLNAIKILDYRPNILARSLKGKGSSTIGVIISDIREGFFAEVIKAIESIASRRGYNVILCDSEDSTEKENFYIDILMRKGIDGLIFAPVDTSQSHEELEINIVPIVQIDRKVRYFKSDFVGIDNIKSAEIATHYLFDNGYRRVGFLGYGIEVYTMEKRIEGYKKAVFLRGIMDKPLIKALRYNQEEMSRTIKEWILNNDNIDALICGNDDICFATLTAVEELELNIPGDIGIISFDDSKWFRFLKCPVTALRQPTQNIGEMAVKVLTDRIEGKLKDDYKNIILDTELIIRDSCAGSFNKYKS